MSEQRQRLLGVAPDALDHVSLLPDYLLPSNDRWSIPEPGKEFRLFTESADELDSMVYQLLCKYELTILRMAMEGDANEM